MPKFFYIARDRHGKKIVGYEDSATQEEIVSRLQARDLLVINIGPDEGGRPRGSAAVKARFRPKHGRVTAEDLMLFCRQFATLLGAGVTIIQSLDIIARQVSSRRLYGVIKELQKNMEAGLSLHGAMAKHPRVFSELWVNLVESGEASGNLAMVLARLASYLERITAFKRKIISALFYPIILMVAGLIALLFLTVKIIPTFADLFSSFHLDLPFLTKVLIAVSAFIRQYFLALAGFAILAFYLFKQYTNTRDGRLRWERFKFSLPIFGEFFRALTVERFSSEMSTLVESGVPILYSLEIAEHSVGNLVMGDIIRNIKEEVRQGRSLSQPMDKSGFFEPMVVQMVNIGEEIGELAQMFKRINAFYQEYAETFLTRFTAMFEPVMLMFMGVIIGLMVIGMFLPIFQLTKVSM